MNLFVLFLFLFPNVIFLNDSFNNLFESRDYIILLRHSNLYSMHKLDIEKIIEGKKKVCVSISKLKNIKDLNLKVLSILDKVYDAYSDIVIKSQIYQIKFEIESFNLFIDKMESYYKKTAKCEQGDILKLEKSLFRMEIYLKGLSNKISEL